MLDLPVSMGSDFDIMSRFGGDLEWLDYTDDINRILYLDTPVPDNSYEAAYYDRGKYMRQDATEPKLDTDKVTADDAKTQAIFDYCYDTLALKLQTSKKIRGTYDYMYPLATYRAPCNHAAHYTIAPDTLPAKSIAPLNDYYGMMNRNSTGVFAFKTRYPYISFYYTMIAVLYDDSGTIIGFRLYDWLTDTAADYAYASVKQRLTEASVRITNLEVIGNIDKQLICTQGRFEWYTSLNASGEPINLYRPFVYLTPLHINTETVILVDYKGIAIASRLTMNLLSIGIANLALRCRPNVVQASKSFKTALPFGSIPLIPGEDFVGHVMNSTFYQGDAFTYTCYRAFLLPSLCTTAWAELVSQTAKSGSGNAYTSVFQFCAFSMCYFNGKFAQYLVPLQAATTLDMKNYSEEYTVAFDRSSPANNLANVFPLYPDLESNGLVNTLDFKSQSYSSTYLRATNGVLVKSTDNPVTRMKYTTFNDRTITHEGKTYHCLRDPITFRFPRGYFDMPLFALKVVESYHDLNATFEMINAGLANKGSDDTPPYSLQYHYDKDTMEIRADKPILLRKVTCPLSMTLAAQQELIEGCVSMVSIMRSNSEKFNNLVINVTTGSSILSVLRGTSRDFTIKNLTLNGNFTSLPAFSFADYNPVVDYTRLGAPNLVNVAIPDTIEVIGAAAFKGQSCLKNINMPANVKLIDAEAFMMCEGLTHLELPEGLRVIGARAFAGCEGLQSVVIPSTVTFIGSEAFRDCNLQSVIIKREPGTIEIAEGAFDGNGVAVEALAETYEGIPLGVDVAAWRKKKDEGKSVTTITATSTENAKNNLYSKHFLDLFGNISVNSLHVKAVKKDDYSVNSLTATPDDESKAKKTRTRASRS